MRNKALRSAWLMERGVRKIEKKRPSGIVQRCVPCPHWRATCENNQMFSRCPKEASAMLGWPGFTKTNISSG